MQILTHKSQNKPRKLLERESRSHTYMEHIFLIDRTDPSEKVKASPQRQRNSMKSFPVNENGPQQAP